MKKYFIILLGVILAAVSVSMMTACNKDKDNLQLDGTVWVCYQGKTTITLTFTSSSSVIYTVDTVVDDAPYTYSRDGIYLISGKNITIEINGDTLSGIISNNTIVMGLMTFVKQ